MRILKIIASTIEVALAAWTLWYLFTVNINDLHAVATLITWILVIDGILYNIERYAKKFRKE